jgi:hypothetical protein
VIHESECSSQAFHEGLSTENEPVILFFFLAKSGKYHCFWMAAL